MDIQMYPSVHLECDGTVFGSMEPRSDNDVQATHVGTIDQTHKSRDHDLCWNQMKNNKKIYLSECNTIHCHKLCEDTSKFLNTADFLLDCKSRKYWIMMQKKESDSICPKPSNESLST